MMLTAKGRYAVMAMAELALSGGERPLTLQAIATKQEIPLTFLEQIFRQLRKAGLVASVRGPGGGYHLGRDPSAITVLDIVSASEESTQMTRCGKADTGCMTGKARCLTHDLWEGLEDRIDGYLASITLEALCASAQPKAAFA